jgi:hypothetical protein
MKYTCVTTTCSDPTAMASQNQDVQEIRRDVGVADPQSVILRAAMSRIARSCLARIAFELWTT